MLASDDNNPQFAGAHNPDSRLSVRFYAKPVQNEFLSKKEARPIFQDVDYVEINIPGDQLNVLNAPVRQDHKERFPLQWARYQNAKGAEVPEIGTPLSQWQLLTPAMAAELRHFKFTTVEHVANASDLQLQSIGMVAGMSPFEFRERARTFLKVASAESASSAESEKLKVLEEENARIKAEAEKNAMALQVLQEQMQTLLESKGKPGRKPKQPETV